MTTMIELACRAAYGHRISELKIYSEGSQRFVAAVDKGWPLVEGEVRAAMANDPYRLPIEMVPEGWGLQALLWEDDESWLVRLECDGISSNDRPAYRTALGPTPRAAMLAAIEKMARADGGKS